MAETKRQGVEIHKMHFSGKGSGLVKKGFHATSADATPAVVYAHPLAEGKAVVLEVTGVSIEDDASEGARYKYTHAFRRAAAGNVTAIGSATSVAADDSSGTPTVTIAANTSDQTCDVTITGEASKDLLWELYVELIEVSI